MTKQHPKGHPLEGLPVPQSNKTQEMKDSIDALFPGTKAAIDQDKCPLCGQPIKKEDFKDKLSIKEYGISGMCQKCQDDIFKDPEDDDEEED